MNNDNRDKYFEAGRADNNQQNGASELNKSHSSYAQGNDRVSEDAEFTPIDSSPSQPQNTGKQEGPTYYSFGHTQPVRPVQQSYQSAPQQHSNYAYGSNNRPYETNQYMNSHQSAQENTGEQPSFGATSNEANQAATYRSFTTSTVGKDPFAKKNKQHSSGFGKIFLSFMAGVVAVGLLMYTADVQNWFSKEATVMQSNAKSGNSSGSSSGYTQGTATSLMMDRPDNISELFSSASPAVVKIETYSQQRSSGSSLFDDPFFRQFFGYDAPKVEEKQSKELVQTGMGTGFFFESDGYILTNQHVVSDADEIRVIVEGHEEPFTATLLGSSYQLDLAVLKVDSDTQFPTLKLGNSDTTKIGDWVVAIGNPYGFDHTLTVGVISAKERPIDITDSEGTRNYENLLQTDASINPGNSGGPLLNMNGEVIGINTAVSSQAQGIGFAIPTSTIMEVLESLKNNEPVAADASPFIGVDLSDLTENLAQQLGLNSTEGTIVRSVYYNSPAYKAGIKQYDIITAADDKKIKNYQELVGYIKEKKVGDVIELAIIRDGQQIKLSVEIGDKNQFNLD